MPPDRRVLLHLGAQKTGTTAVQAWCRDHAEELLQYGVATRTTQPEIRAALDGYEVAGPEPVARLASFLDAGFGTADRLFYSCESNAGPAFLPRGGSTLYPRADSNFAGVAAATAGLDRTVVFTVRDYGQLIESAFVQQIKQGRSVAFDDFLVSLDPSMSWLPVVESLLRHFGADRVIIYDYDADRADELPLMGKLIIDALAVLGAPVDLSAETWDRVSNPRYSRAMVDVSLAGLPYLRNDQERLAFKEFVETSVHRRDSGPAHFLTDRAAANWQQRYAADLASIADRVELR